MALTEKQKLFADEYLIDLNATRAYKDIYKSCKKDESANVNGCKLLRNAKVAGYIAKRMQDRQQRTEITQDKVLNELAKIGFANITDFVTINKLDTYTEVVVKATDSIPLDKIGAIAGIKEGANGIEVKTNDKVKALELLGRHLGMFKDNVNITGAVPIVITGEHELDE